MKNLIRIFIFCLFFIIMGCYGNESYETITIQKIEMALEKDNIHLISYNLSDKRILVELKNKEDLFEIKK